MTRNFVDLETGELIEDVVSIRTAKQEQAYKDKKERDELINRSKEPFISVNQDLGGIEKMLNSKDLGYFLIMMSYADYENRLKASPDAKVPLVRKEIQKILKVSEDTMRGIVNRFKKADLIKIETVKRYGKNYKSFVINSKYAFRKGAGGANSDKKVDNTVKLFINTIQSAYAESDTLTPADIGFIYKCIPYLHYETNYLVHNPHERDYSKLEYVTIKELSEIQGHSTQITTLRLANTVFNDMYMFSRNKIGNLKEVKIKANPMVIYRKAGTPPKEITVEFFVKPKKDK